MKNKIENKGFKTPESYFLDLENKILAKTQKEEKNKKMLFFKDYKSVYKYAAVIAMVAFISYLLIGLLPQDNSNVEIIAKAEQIAVDQEGFDITDEDFLEVINEELEQFDYHLQEDILIEYLTYNDIDL